MKANIIILFLLSFINSAPFDGSKENKYSFLKMVARNTIKKKVPLANEIKDIKITNAQFTIIDEEKDNIDSASKIANNENFPEKIRNSAFIIPNSPNYRITYNFFQKENEENKSVKCSYYVFISYTFTTSEGKKIIMIFDGNVEGIISLKKTYKVCDNDFFNDQNCVEKDFYDSPSDSNFISYFHNYLDAEVCRKVKGKFETDTKYLKY